MPSTTDWRRTFVVAVLLLAGCNCGSRTLADTGDTGSDTSSGSSGSTTSEVPPDLPPDLPPACEDPDLLCDGECIDPYSSNDHCGECGHTCTPFSDDDPQYYYAGKCRSGTCRPTFYECISEADGFTTCHAYCNSIGQTCLFADGSSGAIMWGADYRAACEAGNTEEGSVNFTFTYGCETEEIPFGDFEIPDGGGTATYARCLCTQD